MAQDLSGQWLLHWDDAGTQTAQQVIQPHIAWQLDTNHGFFGYRSGVLWLRFDVPATPTKLAASHGHILLLGQPYLDRMELYLWGASEPLAVVGDSVPSKPERVHPTRHGVRLPVSTQPQTWLLRIQTTSAMNISVRLIEEAKLIQTLPTELLSAGAIFTLYLLAAGMYTVSAAVLRQPIQWSYSLYMVCLLAIFVGTQQPLLLNDLMGSPGWANWVTGFGILIVPAASALLWARALDLRHTKPQWLRIYQGIFVFFICSLGTINTKAYRWAALAALLGVLVLIVFSIGLAIWFMRCYPANRLQLGLFVLAFAVSVLAAVALNLSVAGIITSNPWFSLVFDVSALVHVVLLAVATNWSVLHSERKNREATFQKRQLAEQQVQIRAFSAFVAHELLNPLARIGRSAEMALREWVGPERTRRRLSDMRAWAFESGKLVEVFLNNAALQSGQAQLRPVSVNLAEWMQGVYTEFTLNYPQARLHIIWPQDQDISVVLDPLLGKLALENILINALKYAGQKGEITIQAQTQGTGVTLTVDDEGPGLRPEQYALVGHSALLRPPTQEQPGFGLGLSLVAHIAKAHGGQLHAQPRHPRGVRWVLEFGQVAASDSRPGTNA
ncbi:MULTISPECIES: sensor histidine kinase [Giesbergeria]|uniref:histidine kinase n=1 Tax=Giesbergeria sinuosa TaxID=80883 RepID=A0ABV9QAK5_9BURK